MQGGLPPMAPPMPPMGMMGHPMMGPNDQKMPPGGGWMGPPPNMGMPPMPPMGFSPNMQPPGFPPPPPSGGQFEGGPPNDQVWLKTREN